MYGAIIGDMVGSPYEHHNINTKDFALFSGFSRFTDDSVMTAAIADALMAANDKGITDDEKATKELIVNCMTVFGLRYPNAGYGRTFYHWLHNRLKEPYFSWGNGSAMRVSPAGWLYDDIETTRKMAAWTAEVTHNHPQGIIGAEAVASAIFLARHGSTKDEIKEYITSEFGYDLSKTCDEIRPGYYFDVSCQGSVPQAITAFLDGKNFEDVVRTAISLGGDSDTIGAMAGSIAEAFYGVPDELKRECESRLPEDLLEVLKKFTEKVTA